ncbi:unnamed protein product [Lampetra planeri]
MPPPPPPGRRTGEHRSPAHDARRPGPPRHSISGTTPARLKQRPRNNEPPARRSRGSRQDTASLPSLDLAASTQHLRLLLILLVRRVGAQPRTLGALDAKRGEVTACEQELVGEVHVSRANGLQWLADAPPTLPTAQRRAVTISRGGGRVRTALHASCYVVGSTGTCDKPIVLHFYAPASVHCAFTVPHSPSRDSAPLSCGSAGRGAENIWQRRALTARRLIDEPVGFGALLTRRGFLGAHCDPSVDSLSVRWKTQQHVHSSCQNTQRQERQQAASVPPTVPLHLDAKVHREMNASRVFTSLRPEILPGGYVSPSAVAALSRQTLRTPKRLKGSWVLRANRKQKLLLGGAAHSNRCPPGGGAIIAPAGERPRFLLAVMSCLSAKALGIVFTRTDILQCKLFFGPGVKGKAPRSPCGQRWARGTLCNGVCA